MRRYLIIALAAIFLVAGAFAVRTMAQAASAASPCQFQKSTSTVAFCDTFDQAAAANSSRSGGLNPTVWGVSEISALDNPSQGQMDNFQPATAPAACGGGSVTPPTTPQICKGQVFDSVNDGGSQTLLGMYPRQPFDIAGRTGDVTFDVSNDSLGPHDAWPTFVYTDQPVPAPYSHASTIDTVARNSFGFTMAGAVGANCPTGEFGVDTMFTTTNYSLSNISYSRDACVASATNPTIQNHIEVQISPTSVVVWASAPGSTSLTEIANASLTMPLTRGLVWMEDVHYNAGKYPPGQRDNTFGWDNLGFDGPILPRDRGYDVPANDQAADGGVNLGWSWNNGLSVQTLPVDQTSLSTSIAGGAKDALVEFTWGADSEVVPTISLNGNAPISTAWPFDSATYSFRTIAVPVPISEVVTGANTITVSPGGSQGSIDNFDLILPGGGGVPTCLDPSNCSSSSGPAPTPTPTHSSTPTPAPPSPTPVTTPTPTPSSAPPPPSASRLTINSRQVYANGVDLPWISYGNDLGGNAWGEYGFHAQTAKLDSDFSTMHSEGITTVRVWGLADGRAGITFNTSGTPVSLDATVFTDLDALNAAAAANGVYVNLVLFDSSFLENAQNLGSGVTAGGHSALIAGNSSALNSVVVKPILSHLASDHNIFSVETMNEPEACISDDHDLASTCGSPVTLAEFNAWTTSVASEAHSLDPGVLVTVGSASSKWVAQYKGDGLDYYQVHDYYDVYAPDVSSTLATNLALGKPVVIGEYPANSNTATFAAQMNAFYNEGYAGAWVWSFGDVDSVGTYNGPTMTAWNLAHAATQVGTAPTPTPTPGRSPTPTPVATPPPTPSPTPTPTKHHHPHR